MFYRYVALQVFNVCVQHIHKRCCLRIFSFLFTMYKNRSALTIKAMISSQAVFRVTPKIFDDVVLYTLGGSAVNFDKGRKSAF